MRSRRVLIAVAVVVLVAAVGAGAWAWRNRAPERSVAAFCDEMAAAQDLDDSFAVQDVARITEQGRALDAAVEVAPPDIEPAVEVGASLTRTVASAVRSADDPALPLDAALRANQAELAAAEPSGRAVQAYVAANCDLDLNPGDTSQP